jgi:hypothetical protein
MTRRSNLALASALAIAFTLAASTLAGCGPKLVRVVTGVRVVCTYGEVVSDSVKAIEVPADKASGYSVVTRTVTCDRHKRLEALYAQAQAAIAAGKLADAKSALAELVKIDASFKKAQTQLDAIQAGKKPAADTGTPAPKPGAGVGGEDKQPVGPVANLSDRVPATLSGYTAAPIVADVYTLTREYTPGPGAPTDSLVIVVEQYKDATAAKRQISRSVASDYPSSVATVKVEGRSVRFGTDGRRFATAAWNENGVLIVIEGSSASRKPAALKDHLIALVGEIVK